MTVTENSSSSISKGLLCPLMTLAEKTVSFELCTIETAELLQMLLTALSNLSLRISAKVRDVFDADFRNKSFVNDILFSIFFLKTNKKIFATLQFKI